MFKKQQKCYLGSHCECKDCIFEYVYVLVVVAHDKTYENFWKGLDSIQMMTGLLLWFRSKMPFLLSSCRVYDHNLQRILYPGNRKQWERIWLAIGKTVLQKFKHSIHKMIFCGEEFCQNCWKTDHWRNSNLITIRMSKGNLKFLWCAVV